MSKTGMNRRKLLASVPALCVLTIGISPLIAGTKHGRELSFLADMLVQQLEDRKSAGVLGHEYLRGKMHEADVGRLTTLILSDPEGQALANSDFDHDSCYAYLNLRFKSDFEQGRMVEVGGWILSESEARVYALAAIL